MPRKARGRRAPMARGKVPQLVVLSREDAELYEPSLREICISISDPEAEPARVSSEFAAVLRLQFHDVTQRGEPSDILFVPEHARAIHDFLEKWPDPERTVMPCNMRA